MSNRKTVLLIAEFYSVGGTGIYFNSLLEFYKKTDFRVVILLEDYQVNLVEDAVESGNIIVEKRRNRKRLYKRFPYNLFFDFFLLLKLFVKYKIQIITLSIQSPGSYLAAFMFPLKINYIVHSKISGKGKKYFNIGHFLKVFSSSQKKIIGVSSYTEVQIRKFWSYDHTVIIPNYSRFNVPKRFSNYQNEVILTLGKIVEDKNPLCWIQTAIQVLSKIKEKKIVFAWAGSGDSKIYQNMIPEKFKSNILFLEQTKDISKLFESALLYFHPSLYENLSLSIIEAMSYSLPIVALNIGGNAELVEDKINGGIVINNDPGLFCEKILEVIGTKDKYDQLCFQSYYKYENNFTLQRWLEKIEAIH